jgi:hypothetical protein
MQCPLAKDPDIVPDWMASIDILAGEHGCLLIEMGRSLRSSGIAATLV